MNRDNHELQILLKNLDSIVDKIKHVLVSTNLVPSKNKETPFFLTKSDNSDLELILVKINKYKKLRAEIHDSSNRELEVDSLMDIFADTENMVKKLSESSNVFEYTENGFFDKFSNISHEIKRLVA
jgi:hypothetical protein